MGEGVAKTCAQSEQSLSPNCLNSQQPIVLLTPFPLPLPVPKH